jgi:hypothetical protein
MSNFGVYLVSEILGIQKAKLLNEYLISQDRVDVYLESFKFTERWQYTPDLQELEWLREQKSKLTKSKL